MTKAMKNYGMVSLKKKKKWGGHAVENIQLMGVSLGDFRKVYENISVSSPIARPPGKIGREDSSKRKYKLVG